MSLRRIILLAASCALLLPSAARAAGGNYVFDGGTPTQRAQVTAALNASSFDWSIVPTQVAVHIAQGVDSEATPGAIWLDAGLVDSGRFAWGTIQHEYAHQVDFFLLSAAARTQLQSALGGGAWWQSGSGGSGAGANAPDGTLQHASLTSERFASTLAWSYWQSPSNALKPHGRNDESGAMAPAKFRQLLAGLLARTGSAPVS
jgi:hypothetical protein